MFTTGAVSATVILMMIVVWQQQTMFPVPYTPNPVLLGGSLIVIGFLLWLSYRFKDSRIHPASMRLLPPRVFALAGIFLIFGNVFVLYILVENQVPSVITLCIQGIILLLYLGFAFFQILHKNITLRHLSAFIVGSLGVFCLFFAPLNEVANHMLGMIGVGIILFILFLFWRRYVLKNRIPM
jgi:drug/metabolite transporter (DMT)-like permease